MKAIYKLNGGRGAILCNRCNTIVETGHGHDLNKEYYCIPCQIDRFFEQPVPTVDEYHA